jgi:hypothetical protein
MRELEELIKNKFQLTQFMLEWIKNINKELPEFWKTFQFDKNRIVML